MHSCFVFNVLLAGILVWLAAQACTHTDARVEMGREEILRTTPESGLCPIRSRRVRPGLCLHVRGLHADRDVGSGRGRAAHHTRSGLQDAGRRAETQGVEELGPGGGSDEDVIFYVLDCFRWSYDEVVTY